MYEADGSSPLSAVHAVLSSLSEPVAVRTSIFGEPVPSWLSDTLVSVPYFAVALITVSTLTSSDPSSTLAANSTGPPGASDSGGFELPGFDGSSDGLDDWVGFSGAAGSVGDCGTAPQPATTKPASRLTVNQRMLVTRLDIAVFPPRDCTDPPARCQASHPDRSGQT